MQYLNLESLLSNISFTLLFLLMVYYWYNTVTMSSKPLRLGKWGMFLSNLSLGGLLCIRWLESKHFPLSNLYESLIFLAWSFTLLHILLVRQNTRSVEQTNSINEAFLGSIIAPSALLTSSFASFSLPEDMQKVTPLVPALQSNWLMMHVTVMILSYAALIAGALLAMLFLVFSETTSTKEETASNGTLNNPTKTKGLSQGSSDMTLTGQTVLAAETGDMTNVGGEVFPLTLPLSAVNETKNFELTKTIDNLSYRSLSIGFCFLTIGIISGAVWANEAWGSYWSWDPKETWALITWLVFATYLHIRLKYGWEGKKPALIASGGFFVIWVCYLGVNLFGKGLHTYGFWN